jgi:hypothetical protein
MSKFILTTYQSNFECSTDYHIPIEADSKEHIKAFFIKSIKASWNEEHSYLPDEFKLIGDSVEVLGYRDFSFTTINFLEFGFMKSNDYSVRPNIESKEDLDCMIESDFVFDIQTIEEWFDANKFTCPEGLRETV